MSSYYSLSKQGPPGTQGSTGDIGSPGDRGPLGFQGPQGFQGVQGFQGETGPQGFQGFQGNSGDASNTGATGPQGTQGPAGSGSGSGAIKDMMVVGSTASIVYTTDFISWNTPYLNPTLVTNGFINICYNGTIWVATSPEGLCFSVDGINWGMSISGKVYLNSPKTVVYTGAGTWLAGGSSSGASKIITSTDGIHWNNGSGTPLGSSVNIIISNGAYFWAGGDSIGYSSDGANWVVDSAATSLLGSSCSALAGDGTHLVAGDSNGTMIYYDGTTWASIDTSSLGFTSVNSIAYRDSTWVAGGAGGTNGSLGVLAYSSDGIIWTLSTSGSDFFVGDSNYMFGIVTCVKYNPNTSKWYAGGYAGFPNFNFGTGRIIYSSDAITWLEDFVASGMFPLWSVSSGLITCMEFGTNAINYTP